jgi:hypothetical protein
MEEHLAPYYNDPLRDRLSEVEDSIVLGLGTPFRDDDSMDAVGGQLGIWEQSIEGTTTPPPPPPPDLPVATLPPSLAYGGPQSPDPPALAEPWERDRPGLMAPPAARPFSAREGLDDRGYHPQLGGSTGIRADRVPRTRWCDERKAAVTYETCASCPSYGVEECCYESEREKEAEEPEHEE